MLVTEKEKKAGVELIKVGYDQKKRKKKHDKQKEQRQRGKERMTNLPLQAPLNPVVSHLNDMQRLIIECVGGKYARKVSHCHFVSFPSFPSFLLVPHIITYYTGDRNIIFSTTHVLWNFENERRTDARFASHTADAGGGKIHGEEDSCRD